MNFKAGEGFFQVEDPENDEATILRYRQAIAAALAQFENAVKLAVRSGDRVGLESIRADVAEMFEKADNTLRKPSS